MPLSIVNTWAGTNDTGGASPTLAVSPSTLGDILIVGYQPDTSVTGLPSGGGVTTWNAGAGSAVHWGAYIYWGVVTATGAATITLPAGGTYKTFFCQQWTGGPGTWGVDGVGGSNGGSAGGTIDFPSLSPVGGNELYLGIAGTRTYGISGSTPGFTYLSNIANSFSIGNGAAINAVYDTACSNPNAYAPVASTSSIDYDCAANLFTFTPAPSGGAFFALVR